MKKSLSKKANKELAKEINLLAKGRKTVSPKALVDAARSKKSPLHKYFDWDDRKAAEKWRIEQARYYLRMITIYVEEVDAEIRAFMPADKSRGNKPRGYIPMHRILSSEERMENMLEIALEELRAFKVKYSMLKNLCEAISEIIEKTEKKRKRRKR
jgi:hypothetical protein